MDLQRQAMDLIEKAENGIALLATEAAAQRDYRQASVLLALAQRIAEAPRAAGLTSPALAPILQRDDRTDAFAPAPAGNGSAALSADPAPPRLPAAPSAPAAAAPRPAATVRLPPPASKADVPAYPRFKREGETLVKIGWSKSDRTTYEHRSPRDVLMRLVAGVKRFGAGGERFTTEDLMPLRDDQGEELPSYQAYLCLAWLVTAGLLEKHGRQGYTLLAEADVEQAVEAAWQGLPKR